jgi:hypothetical protein
MADGWLDEEEREEDDEFDGGEHQQVEHKNVGHIEAAERVEQEHHYIEEQPLIHNEEGQDGGGQQQLKQYAHYEGDGEDKQESICRQVHRGRYGVQNTLIEGQHSVKRSTVQTMGDVLEPNSTE